MIPNTIAPDSTDAHTPTEVIVGCSHCNSGRSLESCAGRAATEDVCIEPCHARRGDWVTVRSLPEILATLDANGKYENMPFMPEMIPFCGQTFRIHRRADKTCIENGTFRSLCNTVFLEGLRCDGASHDGCQRRCLLFWKEAWLKLADANQATAHQAVIHQAATSQTTTENESTSPVVERQNATNNVERLPWPTKQGDRYSCQSTELAGATHDFPPGRLHHYWNDLQLGELSWRRFAYILSLAFINRIVRVFHHREYQQLFGEQQQTADAVLNLQPGEWVEVKSSREILATLDAQGRNRGLLFETEMTCCCGRRFRVAMPIEKIISETTGHMVLLNNTVTLEGLVCQGLRDMNCPRANYFYWREVWLKRVEE